MAGQVAQDHAGRREPCRRRRRIGVLPRHQCRRATRGDAAAALRELRRQPRGECHATLVHGREPGAGDHARGRERECGRLAGERRRVVAARVGDDLGVQALRRVTKADVARRERAHAVAQGGGDVEHPGAVGAAQPLLPGGRIGGGAEGGDVDRDRARALRAVEDHRHVDVRERGRSELARDPGHVRDRDERRRGADGVGDVRDRHRADRDTAATGRDQRPDQPGMLAVGRDDLVARPEVHPGEHRADALAGGCRQRHVAGRRAEHARVQLAQTFLLLDPCFEMPVHPPMGRLLLERLPRRREGGRGHRSVGARVQVGEALEDREGRAQRGDAHPP